MLVWRQQIRGASAESRKSVTGGTPTSNYQSSVPKEVRGAPAAGNRSGLLVLGALDAVRFLTAGFTSSCCFEVSNGVRQLRLRLFLSQETVSLHRQLNLVGLPVFRTLLIIFQTVGWVLKLPGGDGDSELNSLLALLSDARH